MKHIEGVIFILIGLLIMCLRVISSINIEELYRISNMGIVEFGEFTRKGMESDLLSHSPITIIIGILFIVLGIIKIREVMKNE